MTHVMIVAVVIDGLLKRSSKRSKPKRYRFPLAEAPCDQFGVCNWKPSVEDVQKAVDKMRFITDGPPRVTYTFGTKYDDRVEIEFFDERHRVMDVPDGVRYNVQTFDYTV